MTPSTDTVVSPSSGTGPARAEIGVIGGSGFYTFLADTERVTVSTPFGDPSDDVLIGEVQGRRVAFLARHGQGHRYPPHRVNYRANLWALRSVGVRQVLAPCAVGSLKPEHGPGTIVVPDQVVDRTWGREHTVHDAGVDGGEAVTHEEVLKVFARSIDSMKAVLKSTIVAMPAAEDDAEATCACQRSLDGLKLPITLPT